MVFPKPFVCPKLSEVKAAIDWFGLGLPVTSPNAEARANRVWTETHNYFDRKKEIYSQHSKTFASHLNLAIGLKCDALTISATFALTKRKVTIYCWHEFSPEPKKEEEEAHLISTDGTTCYSILCWTM